MLYDCKRISYRIDRRLSGLAGPDYAAPISFGLPLEPEDSQYGECRVNILPVGGDPGVRAVRAEFTDPLPVAALIACANGS